MQFREEINDPLPRNNGKCIRKKRIATDKYWMEKWAAEKYASLMNKYYPQTANARVVKDSARVRRMIP